MANRSPHDQQVTFINRNSLKEDGSNQSPARDSPTAGLADTDGQIYELPEGGELRFEVEGAESQVRLKLISGTAEIFGVEIPPRKVYVFPSGSKIAVFTWHGAKLCLSGDKPEVAYTSTETPMVIYSNVHGFLEEERQAAKDSALGLRGPSLMVVGPTDVGKSSLCKILLNYAVRTGWCPIYVDLDIGQGQIGIPGTIGSVLCEKTSDPVTGTFSMTAPMILHFGHLSPSGNLSLYDTVTKRLAEIVDDKRSQDSKVNAAGVIINTMGWVTGQGYDSLITAANAFKVDKVIVLDQERLYIQIKRDLPDYVNVVLLPKSGGVVERPKEARIQCRESRIREYFYGTKESQIYPYRIEFPFNAIKIYKIGAPNLPSSCLPLGVKPEDNKTKLVLVSPDIGILNHILCVSYAASIEDNYKAITSNVMGFVCVISLDKDKKTLSLLSPQPKPLPQNVIFLLSEVQYMDNVE